MDNPSEQNVYKTPQQYSIIIYINASHISDTASLVHQVQMEPDTRAELIHALDEIGLHRSGFIGRFNDFLAIMITLPLTWTKVVPVSRPYCNTVNVIPV